MADNFQLPIPTTAGDVAAGDEIAGVKYQRIKLTLGADGVNDGDVSASNPLPISGGIADGAASSGDMLLVGGQTAGGIAQVFETNGSGHLHVSDGGGSITVDSGSGVLSTTTAKYLSTKTLSYTGENLTQMDEVIGGVTYRTTLTYSGSTLTDVSRVVV